MSSQEHLNALLDSAPDPMLTVARDGCIVRCNRMAVQFFGYSREDLLGMKVETLIPARFRPGHENNRDKFFHSPLFRGMGVEGTLSALTKDGHEPNVEISLSHWGEGTDRLAIVTLRDMTKQVATNKALHVARETAELALQRERAMQEDLVRAEKLAALGGLVAGVAHEVNTPIGVALSAASHLEDETRKAHALYAEGELGEDDLIAYFQTATEAARLLLLNIQRAAELIQSFKRVAVDQVSGEQRCFDLAIYLNEILMSLLPTLRNAAVEVRLECPEGITMDSNPGALSQVITNLIHNAVLHAFDQRPFGLITLSVKRATEDGMVELVCQDNGNGIAPDLIDKVFDPFFTTRRSQGGSGLGLHIVYTLVQQALHGRITLSSEVGTGTKFALHLPLILKAQ